VASADQRSIALSNAPANLPPEHGRRTLRIGVGDSAASGGQDRHRPHPPLPLLSTRPADLTDLASHVARWSGNPCEILDRSEQGLAAMAANGERLLTGIRQDGRALVGSLQTVPVPVEVA